jgi:glycosyltransferase involved in cell wall biosynthesis
MSAGVPVIASRVGGIPEIIRSEENGILVENDAAEIAAAMRRILDDPVFGRRLGEAARRTVMDRFTVEHLVRRTMEVYRQVLS